MKTTTYEKISQYQTTAFDCQCPDFQYRQKDKGGKCKHIVKLIDDMKQNETTRDFCKCHFWLMADGDCAHTTAQKKYDDMVEALFSCF